MYSGAIGEKQGLDSILAIADQLRNLPDLKFIVCGSGPYQKELEDLAEQLKLQNVNFMPLQAHSEFNEFLNLADVHLVIQKASASDLVMPSKLTTILAVGGLAIITANPGSGLHSLVNEHRIGVLVDAENTHSLKECILRAVSNDLKELNRNARRYAEDHLSSHKVLLSYERHIHKGNADYELNDGFAGLTAVSRAQI
jgi:colanic acid biosynthesis glycosyl transferase WcaI